MSVLQELDAAISKLPVSKPIFNILNEPNPWDRGYLSFVCVDKVDYMLHEVSFDVDPIGALVKLHFQEMFDMSKKTFVVNVEGIKSLVIAEVRSSMLSFINTRMNPKINVNNALLWKWYNSYAMYYPNFGELYFESMLGIYKYLKLNALKDDAIKHETNVIALLELIFQRDYKEEHMPQRRRRKHRRRQ